MNNTIETNQRYQKLKVILTARHIISWWLSSSSVLLHQVISMSAATAASQSTASSASQAVSQSPDDCYLAQHLLHLVGTTPVTLNYNMVKGFFARRMTKSYWLFIIVIIGTLTNTLLVNFNMCLQILIHTFHHK